MAESSCFLRNVRTEGGECKFEKKREGVPVDSLPLGNWVRNNPNRAQSSVR